MYGVFKLCNEGMARIYWQDHGIPSDPDLKGFEGQGDTCMRGS